MLPRIFTKSKGKKAKCSPGARSNESNSLPPESNMTYSGEMTKPKQEKSNKSSEPTPAPEVVITKEPKSMNPEKKSKHKSSTPPPPPPPPPSPPPPIPPTPTPPTRPKLFVATTPIMADTVGGTELSSGVIADLPSCAVQSIPINDEQSLKPDSDSSLLFAYDPENKKKKQKKSGDKNEATKGWNKKSKEKEKRTGPTIESLLATLDKDKKFFPNQVVQVSRIQSNVLSNADSMADSYISVGSSSSIKARPTTLESRLSKWPANNS